VDTGSNFKVTDKGNNLHTFDCLVGRISKNNEIYFVNSLGDLKLGIGNGHRTKF